MAKYLPLIALFWAGLVGAGPCLAEDSVAIDPLRTAVNSAELIVKGTLVDVKRRDVFVRARGPELHSRIEYYFDSAFIKVDEVLWGEISTNPIPICFPSRPHTSSDPRTHMRDRTLLPAYSAGAIGYWVLTPKVHYLFRYILRGSPDYMVPLDTQSATRLRELVAARRSSERRGN